MNLDELRAKIDLTDKEIIRLFEERMKIAKEIGDYKKDNNLPVLDVIREKHKLSEIVDLTSDEFKSYTSVLYSLLFELSRSYQGKICNHSTALYAEIENAVNNTEKLFPQSATVACQGVEGAYSQIACEKIFKNASVMYFKNFEGVFTAIEKGLCKYGVLPVENSTAGSVKKIYDLMAKHDFKIVRSTRIKIDHNLLAKPGTKISDIKEVYSHEQAINQCSEYLEALGPNVKVTCCENTAIASEMVAKSDRNDVAALSSRYCADLYGLKTLADSVQNKDNNYTRFICISKNLEIYPGSDKTTVMMVLPHKPGALYKTLARFYALGVNLLKLESRPIPERDFEFMFYFDLETSIYSEEFIELMCEIDKMCEEFKYFGSYLEVI